MDEGYRWGGGADLSPWETVMWRADADPHTRSAGVFVEILEHEPDWDRYVEALERSTRLVPRLRERIVEPALPLVAPAWSTDEEFAIEHHVSRARIPTPGTTAQLHEKVADVMRRPLDRGRPPWVAVLLTGLEGGRAASVFKAHHVLADGQLLMQLLELLHGHSPEPGSRHVPARPARPTVDRYSLVATRLARNAVAAPRGLVRQLAGMPSALVHPVRSVGGAIAYARSLRRQVSPVGVPRSPLLRGQGGTGVRVLTLTVPLAEMRAAGKAAGGSVNDAFLAAMLGGLRRYHEHFHVEVDRIPLTMPVSTRVAGDPAGNRFAAVHLVGPMSEADPARRIALIREQVRAARNEPALDWLEVGSRFIDKLPGPALVEVVRNGAATSDAQLSSFPGVRREAFIAGARVTGIYLVGPRPGVAMMGAMISYQGQGCVGLHVDPDAFTDLEVLDSCLRAGFAEVLTLASTAPTTPSPPPAHDENR
jgi:diacylglycerol O-acyltransferase